LSSVPSTVVVSYEFILPRSFKILLQYRRSDESDKLETPTEVFPPGDIGINGLWLASARKMNMKVSIAESVENQAEGIASYVHNS
jgi:hypothetical protein